jgi:hypothetical protein
MKLHLSIGRQATLVATSMLAGSAIATAPASAASFAEVEGGFLFENFSQDATSGSSITDTSTFTFGDNSGAVAISEADALFITEPAEAQNLISSSAFGAGTNFFALAESEAKVIGNFLIDVPETSESEASAFSFDFSGFLTLFTGIDEPFESASAEAGISFALLDITDGEPILLDSFDLFGDINTPGDEEGISLFKSDYVFLDQDNSGINENLGGSEEWAIAFVSGSYERYFQQDTILSLVEIKYGKASVAADVPEPSSLIALLLVGGSGLACLRKRHA